MKVVLDTNVLLRTAEWHHPHQTVADACVERMRADGCTPTVTAQAIYEYWVVCTRPVDRLGLGQSPSEAEQHLRRLFQAFDVLPENPAVLPYWRTLVVRHSISGKTAHDARIVATMMCYGVQHLVTFNIDDFKRFDAIQVHHPEEIAKKGLALRTK